MDFGADFDYLIKVIVAGNSGVGKSSLLQRYVDDSFSENFISTIGVDFKIRIIELATGKRVKLQIWDTAGQERFRTIVTSYWRGADGVLFVFDLTDRDSFEAVSTWAKDIERHAKRPIPKILIGNKSDLTKNRVVTHTEATDLAKKLSVPYFETSAKTAAGVEIAFRTIAENVATQYQDLHASGPNKDYIKIPNEQATGGGGEKNNNQCCLLM